MILGESPVWCCEERSLYFVDIYGATLDRLDVRSGDLHVWHFNEPVSAFALRENGRGAVVALRGGLALFDYTTEDVEQIGRLENHPSGNRLNDGRCDARGRFWVGSMSAHDASPVGHMYRLDADLIVHRVW
jgi:sugar lactone lactonase YvrE